MHELERYKPAGLHLKGADAWLLNPLCLDDISVLDLAQGSILFSSKHWLIYLAEPELRVIDPVSTASLEARSGTAASTASVLASCYL